MHPPCQHRAGGRQLAELQPRHAHQLERPGFDLRQANRPGQPHASFEPLQGQPLIALQHRRRSGEEQGGGKTCVVARGRLQLYGTLDVRLFSAGDADQEFAIESISKLSSSRWSVTPSGMSRRARS